MQPSNDVHAKTSASAKIPHLFGWAISLGCLAFIASQIDMVAVLDAMTVFRWPYLAFGVASLATGYLFRVVRWCLMLRSAGASVSLRDCVVPFLGSIALNNVLPFRLGDLVRALVFPAAIGLSRTTATGSLFMERIVDLLTLLAVLGLGLAYSGRLDIPSWLPDIAAALAIVGGLTLLAVFLLSGLIAKWLELQFNDRADSLPRRIALLLVTLLRSVESMSRLRPLLIMFALSILVWLGEAGLFLALLYGFDFSADISVAVIVMAIATLSTLVPSSPGYVGPFHLAAYAAVTMLGGSPEQAAGFAVLSHLSLWVPTTVAGAVCMAIKPQIFRGLRAKATVLN